MNLYLDTSALGKIYHVERGSDWMQRAYDGDDTLFVSGLCAVEFASICARRVRERQLSHESMVAVMHAFQDDLDSRFVPISFSAAVFDEATRLLLEKGTVSPLRSLDALHLAFFNGIQAEDAILVTTDKRMLNFAVTLGIRCMDPTVSR